MLTTNGDNEYSQPTVLATEWHVSITTSYDSPEAEVNVFKLENPGPDYVVTYHEANGLHFPNSKDAKEYLLQLGLLKRWERK